MASRRSNSTLVAVSVVHAGQRVDMAVPAEVPLAELDDYQGRLKSLTGRQGSYTIAFSHYAPVPANVQHTLSAQYKAVGLDDE